MAEFQAQATDPNPLKPFWARDPQDWLAALGSSRDGLSSELATARHTAPSLKRSRALAIALRIGRKAAQPLLALLVIAALIAGFLGDWASTAIVTGVVVLSLLLDSLQEHKAEQAAERLRRSVEVQSRVRRDGVLCTIPVSELVTGDIVEVRGGSLVPADGMILEAEACQVDEALLTGETFPVEKRAGASADLLPSEASGALFSGTTILSGHAVMVVVATGADTQTGRIETQLEGRHPRTAFEHGLDALGLLILRMTFFLVLFVMLVQLVAGRPPFETFMFAVALAVGLAPELLPMIVTVTLARGALRLAERKVVVKRLAAIHDLGAMSVLCTDKTGTLTEGHIALGRSLDHDGRDHEEVLSLARLNAALCGGMESPLDVALLAGARSGHTTSWRKIADRPFDFMRRRSAVLLEHRGERWLIVKGAAENVIALCDHAGLPSIPRAPLDEATRAQLHALEGAQAEAGLRSIAVAWRAMPPDRAALTDEDERKLVFAGFCTFTDPPKTSATQAVHRLAAAGIRVKVISGDAPAVVQSLVKTLGLAAHGLLTGAEIARLSDAALAARVRRADLFARVTPDQKVRIVDALRRRGETVGFLGDGINDAPALLHADAGLSVDGATDVARAAADMILLEPDLGVIADGVAEGRRTHANIMKYIRMATSSNFGNMVSMAMASLFLPFLPLSPVQVLLNNLIYDLSEIGLPFDQVDDTEIERPAHWDMKRVLRFMLVMGPVSSVFDMATFVLLLQSGLTIEAFRAGWFLESTMTQVLVIFVIRQSGRFVPPHPALTCSTLGALVIVPPLIWSPLAHVVGFQPLDWRIAGILAGLVLAYLAAAWFARRAAFPGSRHRRA
jgi:Mg2+-importing ATPase